MVTPYVPYPRTTPSGGQGRTVDAGSGQILSFAGTPGPRLQARRPRPKSHVRVRRGGKNPQPGRRQLEVSETRPGFAAFQVLAALEEKGSR